MPNHPELSTSMIRYVIFYMMLNHMRKGTNAYNETRRLWHIADRDVKRDWGW